MLFLSLALFVGAAACSSSDEPPTAISSSPAASADAPSATTGGADSSADPTASMDPVDPSAPSTNADGQPTPRSSFVFPSRASRVVAPELGIDLPVVSSDLQPPPGNYPFCDVAAYLTTYRQPGDPGTTFLYAHAQEGMFLPLLEASERQDGAELIGQEVLVYTDDAELHRYEIFEVERHATTYRLANSTPLDEQRLILQTSEGPYGTIPKLVVAANHLGVEPADPVEANPEAMPRDCRPDELSTQPGGVDSDAIVSRVEVPELDIDLPVVSGDLEVAGNTDDFPLCDVAQYLPAYVQPGEEGTTYIYAHAREGMFLPLLDLSNTGDGSGLIGVEVLVYTDDGQRYRYRIEDFEPEATDFSLANDLGRGQHQLVLQTSIGPSGTVPKLQMAAHLLDAESTDIAEATPTAEPRICG
jgi:sortase (surface protein transpeptidase)